MSNPLFKLFGGGQAPMPGRMGNMQNIFQQFQQFRNGFHGDPRQHVQQMLNTGKISQADYNRAVQMANQFSKMFNK